MAQLKHIKKLPNHMKYDSAGAFGLLRGFNVVV